MAKNPKAAPGQGLGTILSWALMAGLGFLGIWQFHNVEFYSDFDLVPGGRGDNRLVTALLEYFYHALRGEGSFSSPAFYYPAQGTLGYADVFLSYSIPYGILRSFGMDVFSCYQVCGILFSLLNYLCGFLLLYRGLGRGVTASALGAFLFAFNAPKFNQISHPQLQCLFLLPLVVWLAVEWVKRGSKISPRESFTFLCAAVLVADFQLYSGFYMGWFFFFWVLLFFILSLSFKATRGYLWEIWQHHQLPLLGAGVVFVLGLVPFLWIYLPVIRELGGKSYSEIQMMTPDAWSFLWMGPRHSWWGWLWDHSQTIRNYPVEGEERDGLGLSVLAAWFLLTLAAVWFLREKKPPFSDKTKAVYYYFAAVAVLATTLFALLGFKYPGDVSPWRIIYELVPGGGSIRAVSRYVLFIALPLSVFIGLAFQMLLEKVKTLREPLGGRVFTALLFLWGAVMVFEQVGLPPYPAFSKSVDLNRLEYLSEKLPAQCNAFYVDVDPRLTYDATNLQIDAMLLSAVRGIPTLNGYSGANPKDWNLYRVRSPRYHEYVQDWVGQNHIGGPICGVLIDR